LFKNHECDDLLVDLNRAMNFVEIMALHRAVSTFKFEASEEQPKLCIYDTQNRQEGYILFIKTKSPNGTYRGFLESLAEKRMLTIKESRGFIVFHSLWDVL